MEFVALYCSQSVLTIAIALLERREEVEGVLKLVKEEVEVAREEIK